jgi:hypothetical protein
MSIFIKALPRPFKCIAKLLRRSAEKPWVRYSLKKMAGKQNGRGHGLYRTLGWSRDFPRVYGEPLKSIFLSLIRLFMLFILLQHYPRNSGSTEGFIFTKRRHV